MANVVQSTSMHGLWKDLSEPVKSMVIAELEATRAIDVLECLQSNASELKRGNWYEKIKEHFPSVEIEKSSATLGLFLKILVSEKDKVLEQYISQFRYSGLQPTSQNPFHQYVNLNYTLLEAYKRFTILDLLLMRSPKGLEREHTQAIIARIHAELAKGRLQLNASSSQRALINTDTLKTIALAIRSAPCGCYELTLENFGLTDEQLTLFEHVFKSEHIVKLDLRYNNLSDKSASILSQAVTQNTSKLNHLILNHNTFTDSGALEFVPYLQTNRSVRLELAGNTISKTVSQQLEKIAEKSATFSVFL